MKSDYSYNHNHSHHDHYQQSNNRSQSTLTCDQVRRLLVVMKEPFSVHGRGNFPTLTICLRRLIQTVQKRMADKGVHVQRVKMNGGAASHVIALKKKLPYNDIDLIFDVIDSIDFDTIKDAVMDALLEFLPEHVNKDKITSASMKEAYVRKLVKVDDGTDRWSLISLNNDYGRYVELKFVHRMRRQFEFSVDSFQINLDPIVSTNGDDDDENGNPFVDNGADEEDSNSLVDQWCKSYEITAESVYGDFRLALKHLNDMLIDTVQPELIRGGGLLKYVNLLVRGYRPARPLCEFARMERYMCSRFFIDFSSWEQQQRKLRAYMDNHFQGDLQLKYEYLLLLHRIVDESTVCLMSHERRMSLNSIEQLAYELQMELYYQQQMVVAVRYQQQQHGRYHHHQHQQQHRYQQQHNQYLQQQSRYQYHQQQQQQRQQATDALSVISSASSTTASTSSATSATPSPCPSPNNNINQPTQASNTSTTSCSSCCCCHGNQQQQRQQVSVTTADGSQQQQQQHQPRQTLLFVPHNASYWIPVM